MKFRTGGPLLWALIAAARLSAAPVNPEAGVSAGDIAMNIARLSDQSYAVREEATLELWKVGDAAAPQLQKVAAEGDPEASIRARELIRKIQLGILPESSPEIVALVVRYDQGSRDMRREVIRALKNERAYRQILKLYALEKDRLTLEMLEMEVRGVALDAAREALSAQPPDIRGAFGYLKMARPEAAEYMAMASLHRSAGTLDQALAGTGEADHLFRFCLLATTGKLEDAAREADLAGLDQAAARLRMLDGNPLPWIAVAPVSPQMPSPPGWPTTGKSAPPCGRARHPSRSCSAISAAWHAAAMKRTRHGR